MPSFKVAGYIVLHKLVCQSFPLNPLPDDKILDWTKMQACTDSILDLTEKLKLVFERVEKIVEKGENASY